MTTSKIIYIPIYEIHIKITYTSNIYKYVLKNNYSNFSKKEKKTYNNTGACTFDFLIENKFDYSFDAIFNKNNSNEETIVHETFHITKSILENKGCTLSNTSEEAWAYLISYIYKRIRIVLIDLKNK